MTKDDQARTPNDDLLSYLVLMDMTMAQANQRIKDWPHQSFEGFVKTHGQFYTPSPYDPKKWGRRGKVKEYFKNAFNLYTRFPDKLIYVEGFAASIIPMHHAWCAEIKTNKVVDPTWREIGPAYYGVPFQKPYILKIMIESESFGVIDNWKGHFPLLQQPEGHRPSDFRLANQEN